MLVGYDLAGAFTLTLLSSMLYLAAGVDLAVDVVAGWTLPNRRAWIQAKHSELYGRTTWIVFPYLQMNKTRWAVLNNKKQINWIYFTTTLHIDCVNWTWPSRRGVIIIFIYFIWIWWIWIERRVRNQPLVEFWVQLKAKPNCPPNSQITWYFQVKNKPSLLTT